MGAASAGIGAVGGIAQTIIGAGQARRARKAIENYDRQEITNLSTGLKVSTKGADLAKQELARTNATTVSALKEGGVRALMGGLPKVQESTVDQLSKIGADLDEKVMDVQLQEVAGAEKARDMIERREEGDLGGLGQQLNTGQQTVASGLAGFAGSMGEMGKLLADA